jgi:DNA-binding GntR family transcriptional regulator
MEAAERADDWNTVANRDLAFHTAPVAAADSPRLERMFSSPWSSRDAAPAAAC